MKKMFMMAIAAMAMTVASCGGNSKNTDSVDGDSETEPVSEEVAANDTAALKSADGLPMLADFSAEWCPPCRQMKPIFHKLQEEYKGKADLVTIDVDNNPELAQRYNVTSIPTLVYISPEGKELYRTVGFQTEDIIRADIGKYLEK